MDWIGPAFEVVRTGSPYVAGFSSAVLLAGIYLREVRRHYAAELTAWSERYDELQARCSRSEAKTDEATRLWLDEARAHAETIRRGYEVAREVGGS